jgi:hypothetical protein
MDLKWQDGAIPGKKLKKNPLEHQNLQRALINIIF